jgi:C1A family cysteine protease
MPITDIRKHFFILRNTKIIKNKIYNLNVSKSTSCIHTDIIENLSSLPKIIDLRSKFGPVYDQGYIGSCTACALCGLLQYLNPKFLGSRLFVYYNERKLENNIPDDSGAPLENGMLCLQKYGVCKEIDWPYIPNKFAVKPPDKCYKDALKHLVLKVENISDTLINLKSHLVLGFPFIVGIQIYKSFESTRVYKTGIVPIPNINKEILLGGHAVVCVGYNDNTQQWIMRNSWGSSWGINGYFYLPYAYLFIPNLAGDMWTITNIKY